MLESGFKLQPSNVRISSSTTVRHRFSKVSGLCVDYRDVRNCDKVGETNGNKRMDSIYSLRDECSGGYKRARELNAAISQLTPYNLPPGFTALLNPFLWPKAGIILHDSTDVPVARGDWS